VRRDAVFSSIDGVYICSSRMTYGCNESATTCSVRSTMDASKSAASVHGRPASSAMPLA
jgi:hypothetical protein